MDDSVTLVIDEQSVVVPPGTTILKAAQAIDVEIPTICYHEHCTSNGLCRMCVVEVEGARVLSPACVAQVSEGMKVKTRSERVARSRRTIVELLGSTVDLSEAPGIQHFAQDYHADLDRFGAGERRHYPLIDDNPMYIRDYEKCILCWRCVQVCADDAQYTYALNFSGRGFETSIGTFFDKGLTETTCVFCGQCVGVCPTGALKPKREWLLEQGQAPEEIARLTQRGRKKQRG
ncbi:MAG TPA: 2Fe-2S iron-sulfur cluster-binding protein [Anaerolineae bacterium]|nr:2Fe-2S iron-sulfur cluster-binding protein [Anaerolineae bacterium]